MSIYEWRFLQGEIDLSATRCHTIKWKLQKKKQTDATQILWLQNIVIVHKYFVVSFNFVKNLHKQCFVEMVKLFALSIFYKGPAEANLLKCAYDLQSFSFFQRGSVQEFIG